MTSLSMRRAGEVALSLLQALVPKTGTILVHGTPVTEGNAVEIAGALSRRYEGRLIWLVDSEPSQWKLENTQTPVAFVAKWSLRGLYAYLRSEIIFYTHGLYGAVTPSKRQTIVNLWHGDGIKRKPSAERSKHSVLPATYVSGGSQLLTERKAHDFKMRHGSELVFGNPRVIQFRDPVPPAFLETFGVGNRPYIIWMPTFRRSAITGIGYEAQEVPEMMRELVAQADSEGLTVIVKAHRQDAASNGVPGVISITDDDLVNYGVSLYSLIGGSVALVTDYSSVWTEYLLLNRPIGFLIPDADKYVKTRGLYPEDVLDWLPGPRIDTKEDIKDFIRCVSSNAGADGRREIARKRLGLVDTCSPADELLDALAARGCFRHGHLKNRMFNNDPRPRLVRVRE